MKFISQLLKLHVAKVEESDSKLASSTANWKKGINSCQQMYIAQQFWADNGLDSGEDVNSIDDDQLKSLKKVEKALKRWGAYTVQRVSPKRRKVPKEQSIG